MLRVTHSGCHSHPASTRSVSLPTPLLATHYLAIIFRSAICLLSLQVAAAFEETTFAYNGFDGADAKITCLQGSSFQDESIQLTAPGAIQGSGRALYSDPVQFLNSSLGGDGTVLSFSTQFIFYIIPAPEGAADGIAFILSPDRAGSDNSSSGLLGILNSSTNGVSSSHTFAVEFDTYMNPEYHDLDGNHVGIDINDVISWSATPAAYLTNPNFTSAADGHIVELAGGQVQAWIDYDGSKTQLNVSVSRTLGQRPSVPLVSNSSVNLSGVLKDQMYVGFSASTSSLTGVLYYVYAWSFSNNGSSASVSLPTSGSDNKKKIVTILAVVFSVLAVVLLMLVLGLMIVRRRRHTKQKNDLQVDALCLDHLPQKFTYKELSKATNGFSKQHMLGSGGFGSVYKGVLSSSGLPIAVKRISKESKQGLREFVSEVASIGRLRHRNLVPLLGWCHDRGLLLVYEYMPNGSLDKLLFTGKLPWALRVKILTGVAAALLYLHEEWEQKIVHRDVKASNVMLDAEFNARLGDFGLARFYDHNMMPETTMVAGTWGYLAPEYFYTRKATDRTDVYSFGALTLEAACGRRMTEAVEENTLLEWVWKLHEEDALLNAADPKLMMAYDQAQMKSALQLGLVCAHPDPSCRPSMRRVLQVLTDDAPLPPLPASKPAIFFADSRNATLNSTQLEESTSISDSVALDFFSSDSDVLLRRAGFPSSTIVP